MALPSLSSMAKQIPLLHKLELDSMGTRRMTRKERLIMLEKQRESMGDRLQDDGDPFASSSDEASIKSIINQGHLIADVKYDQNQRILLLGEANFSFAAALCKGFGNGNCSNLMATSLEPDDRLFSIFGQGVRQNLARVKKAGAVVEHGIDALHLTRLFQPNSFDRIVFNFPLIAAANIQCDPSQPSNARKRARTHQALPPSRGVVSLDTTDVLAPPISRKARNSPHNSSSILSSSSSGVDVVSRDVPQNHLDRSVGENEKLEYEQLNDLVFGFFKQAEGVLSDHGEVHLRLTDKYCTLTSLRKAPVVRGFELVEKIDFGAGALTYIKLGYKPTIPGRGKSFSLNSSSSIVFRKKPKVVVD